MDERIAILKVEAPSEPDGFGWWRIASWQEGGEVHVSLAPILREPDGRVNTANPQTEPGIEFRLDTARTISIALLKTLYEWMPDKWGMLYPTDDPLEAYAVLSELCREVSPLKHESDPLRNVLALEQNYRRALRLIGKSRKVARKWQARYTNAAYWARRNHRRITDQRRTIRRMQKDLDFIGPLAGRMSARAMGNKPKDDG
jgi:hypothetical protein